MTYPRVGPRSPIARTFAASALLLTLAFSATPAGAVPARTGTALALTANPTVGVAPLLVEFQLTRPNGTPPSLVWDFGDGTYLNGSGAGVYEPVHDYLRSGSFECVVTVRWTTGAVDDSIGIVVRPANLTVTVAATPSNGTAPLTVWFHAEVSGGTGTYLSYVWSFGDGGNGSGLEVRYTFEHGGIFTPVLEATDSGGHTGRGSTGIDVVGPSVVPSGDPAGAPASVAGWLGVGIVGGAALVAAALYVGTRRFRSGQLLTRSVALPVPDDAAGPATSPSPPPSPRPDAPDHDPREIIAGSPKAHPGLAAPSGITDALIRHLAGLPALWSHDLPSKEWTQAGIADAIGAGQSAVSRVLRRLVAAGIVTVETRHVEGSVRRLRIYRLTERGQRLGRALRELRPESPDGTGSGDGPS